MSDKQAFCAYPNHYIRKVHWSVTGRCNYLEHDPDCRGCAYAKLCAGGCRGSAAKDSRGEDLMGKDPFACWFFLRGYYDRAREIIDRLSHPH